MLDDRTRTRSRFRPADPDAIHARFTKIVKKAIERVDAGTEPTPRDRYRGPGFAARIRRPPR